MKEWFIKLFLISFGFSIALVAVEFGLSTFVFNPRIPNQGDYFNEPDEYIGWRGTPNKEGKYKLGRISSYVKINGQGFKDKAHTFEKKDGTFRIVVLGDSFTEAFQLPIEEAFPYILEGKLNSENRKRFEVINLGISGFGTAQEELTLKHYGLRYKPDLVILAFFIGNDVKDNSLILGSKVLGRSVNRPFFVLHNGELEELPFKIKVSNSSRNVEEVKRSVSGPFQILKNFSENLLVKCVPNIYYLLIERMDETPWLANFLWKIGIKKSMPELSDQSRKDGILIDDYVYAEEYPSEWQDAWEVTQALILKLKKELEMDKIGLLVVGIPNECEFRPDVWKKTLDTNPQMRALKFDLRKPEHILSKFLGENKIEHLLLRSGFETYSSENGKDLYFHYAYDNHWNDKGHALAAELIYKRLIEDKLVN